MNSDEDKAHVEGINILVRGLQINGPPSTASPVGNATAMPNASPRPQTGHPTPMPPPSSTHGLATAAGVRAALPLPRLSQPGTAAASKLPLATMAAQGQPATQPERGPTPARMHAPLAQQIAAALAQNGGAGQNGVPVPTANAPPPSIAVPAQALTRPAATAPVTAAAASNGQEPSAEATLLQSLKAATAAI